MTSHSLDFDAVAEAAPGPRWAARWARSWPAYEAWFRARGGLEGPSRTACRAALKRHMPELLPVYTRLCRLAGGSDTAARFLSTWCPPAYLGGCSVASMALGDDMRLVRNYDLSPDLNEGLLLRTEWTGRPVMGMVEFLWGLSDGINGAGLTLALAYGGRQSVAPGFGVTTILRYVLETCTSVDEAIAALQRVPSHMAYNVVVADRSGRSVTVELQPGGGASLRRPAIATNHQHGAQAADRPAFTRTHERRDHLEKLLGTVARPSALADAFLREPLFQDNYTGGFGTLFTAVYDPLERSVTLRWPNEQWHQSLDRFREGHRRVVYATGADTAQAAPAFDVALLRDIFPSRSREAFDRWHEHAGREGADWVAFGHLFAQAGAWTKTPSPACCERGQAAAQPSITRSSSGAYCWPAYWSISPGSP